MRAAWIFTRADVVANLGVILSGVLVAVTGARYPDLIVGAAIGIYVIKEAAEILREAREARARAAVQP
jgi:Co/Zn/Cd efflux system component